jgi:general secretion pathway protein I
VSRRPDCGFTLIEVLVALVIVAFGMSAVLAALTSAADSAARLRDKSLGEWIALNRISTVRLTLSAPKEGKSEEDVDYAGRKWRWRQQVEKTDVPGLLRITVDVRQVPADAQQDVDESKADWLATAVGFRGDALSAASGELPDWRGQALERVGGGAK